MADRFRNVRNKKKKHERYDVVLNDKFTRNWM